ncbi:alpha/beta hydrolase [Candidatus Gottesmanbacteria bacterium]|nr:alpha/beta hydrolase [Candidatus Gottesmanbacteria bacterium]
MIRDIPILILHGWNLSAEKFAPLVNELRIKGFNAQASDLPGFGTSPKPKNPLTLSDYVRYVDKYVKSKNWSEIVIIGHSFGGRLAIKLASQNPKFLKALILSGAPGYNPVPKLKILFFLSLAKLGNAIFALPILKNFSTLSRHFLYRAAQATDFYNTDKNMRDTFKNIVKEELVDYMAQIKVPTLLIWGENDLIVPVSIAKKMSKVIPNAKLTVIPDARHGAPWTHPKEFVESVIKFLDKI